MLNKAKLMQKFNLGLIDKLDFKLTDRQKKLAGIPLPNTHTEKPRPSTRQSNLL